VDGPAPDDDEDYYIPVELVTLTSAIGPAGVTEISRKTTATAWITQAQLDAADSEDDER
jgi:hypothetical protein